MPPLLYLKDVHLTFGTTKLLDGAEFAVGEGERLALVGRNGSGKSTLLKIAAGLMEADKGDRFAQPGATIRYLPQEPSLEGHATTRDYVEAGLRPGDDPNRAFYLLGHLGLSGQEVPATLSGGEARRAALARALAPMPDILLLDEPTNHLDLPAIEWLEGELKAMRAALVLISHDRRFLENLSRAVVWLDRGQTRRLDQGFAAFENWRDMLMEQEDSERHKQKRKIVQELDWLAHGRSARRKRNQGRLARLGNLRQARREQLKPMGSVKMEAASAETSGTKVIDAKGISKSFGDKTVIKGFSLRIHRGDRIGIVGPNGAGKTTLLKLLTGEFKPDAGNVKLGTALQMAKLDQSRASLHPEETLANVLTGGGGDTVYVGGKPRHVISYMQDFLFTGQQARTPVKVLSGGERARLLLARLFAVPSNFLVLDEPTNDLDLETLDLLEEVVGEYPGTALIVSHDRDFLDRVATQIVAAEGEGRFAVYAGGYSDMLAQREQGAQATTYIPEKSASARKPPRLRDRVEAKLKFSEIHSLNSLPGKIEAANRAIARLEAELSDSGLYARDAQKFAMLSARLAEAKTARDADEELWLALELRREAMG
ncbi:MAG TPA: ABC-F family ATP-binding cassette domain-containing protein [Rhizomicrobium sp.]|jgi:ATP-binding cassette subfamily F protein uup|nr:ABC-F family ATP-binding cassette domain-containing protein [Rhizomicrobium sp.]